MEICRSHVNAPTVHSDDVTFFQYVVDLRPPKNDQVSEPPLDASAQAKYCLAAQEWGRNDINKYSSVLGYIIDFFRSAFLTR